MRTVVIEEDAEKSAAGQGGPEVCSRLLVTEPQAQQYLTRARTLNLPAYTDDLGRSPDVASGTRSLADGHQAQLGVQQYGLGWL